MHAPSEIQSRFCDFMIQNSLDIKKRVQQVGFSAEKKHASVVYELDHNIVRK